MDQRPSVRSHCDHRESRQPDRDVTLAQLSDLFQGRTFDWTPFGGSGEVIPVSREAEAFSRQMFEERVMQTRAVTRNAVLKVVGRTMSSISWRTRRARSVMRR